MFPVLLLLSLISPLTAEAQPASAGVTVSQEGAAYRVSATFAIEQPPPVVMTVLTDYERIPEFMPNVERTIVRERTERHAVVEQDAKSHFVWFSKRVHVVLDVTEEATRLTFRDRCADSFRQYEGAWHLTSDGRNTAITYELTAEPAFSVPGLVLKKLLARDSAKMIEGLRREIARRGSLAK
jgi:ribosome-associated toxin RatA of RatAB toxin-antitoxin module